jgi:hypothetical protein
MKEKNEDDLKGFRSKSSKDRSPVSPGIGEGNGRQSIRPIIVVVGLPVGKLTSRARIPLVVSLLFAVLLVTAPIASPAQVYVGVSVTYGPPAIPIYAQPLCPGPDFIWVPGYWAWDPDFGYFWVPGMWVLAPFPGALWTPGYWAWNDGVFIWYEGYWGPVVGYYGGIDYGYGYTGYGYDGGYWSGGRFYYNRVVNNINVTNITTVYSRPVSKVRPSGPSFNGGTGGTTVRPTSEQRAAAHERRVSITDAQRRQMQAARADPKQRATVNRGRPAIAATMKPGEFKGHGVIGASRAGAPYKAPPSRKAAPSEHTRNPKPGAEIRPPARVPEHGASETSQKELEQRRHEPQPAQRPPAATRPSQQEERIRGKGETRPPAATPERMEPGVQRGPERQMNEPRPEQRGPQKTRPLPEQERGKGEKEEPR